MIGKKILLIFIFLITTVVLKAQSGSGYGREVDSLLKLVESAPDTALAHLYTELAWKLRYINTKQAIYYAKQAIPYAEKYHNHIEYCRGYSYAGIGNRFLGNISEALEYYRIALEYAIKYDIVSEIAYAYNNIGNLFLDQNCYELAEGHQQKAIEIAKTMSDSTLMLYSYLNLGRICQRQRRFDDAMAYYDTLYYLKSVSNDFKLPMAVVRKNIADLYYEQGILDSAKAIYNECLACTDWSKHNSIVAETYINLARLYLNSKKIDSALYCGYKALDISSEQYSRLSLKDTYLILGEIYFKLGNYKQADKFFIKDMDFTDSISNSHISNSLVGIQFTVDKYRREQELEIKNQEREYKIMVLNICVVILFLAAITSFMINFNNNKATLINDRLASTREDMNNSIEYTKNIQSAIHPNIEKFGNIFADKYVIFKPKEVVSGDFYWQYEDSEYEMIAVADCSGRGVPGALLTMLGASALQEIAATKQRSASKILELLRVNIKSLLHQENCELASDTDGMNIALIVVNKKTMIMDYAGAMLPLYYIREDEIFKIEPTRSPVGFHFRELPFESVKLQLKNGDCIYLGTDGYAAQVGGDNNKKIKSRRYRDLLVKFHKLPMRFQAIELMRFFLNWKKDNEQIDDILLVGFKV